LRRWAIGLLRQLNGEMLLTGHKKLKFSMLAILGQLSSGHDTVLVS
jgi:hypothetical protein